MSRQARIEVYHVMGRGVARLPAFPDDRDQEEFLSRTARLVHRGDLIVLAFCLMPNHVHIPCRTPRGSPGRWMQLLMGGYALWFNRRYRRVGDLRQGRYNKEVLAALPGGGRRHDRSYVDVESGGGEKPIGVNVRGVSERKSSRNARFRGAPTIREIAEIVPKIAEIPVRLTRMGEKPVDPFERATAGLVLGGEAFVAKIRKMARSLPDDREMPSLMKLKQADRASAEEVEAAVEQIFAGASRRRRGQLLLYALRHQRRFAGRRSRADMRARRPRSAWLHAPWRTKPAVAPRSRTGSSC